MSCKEDSPPTALTPEQRLLLLDTWRRSGLPAGDFAALVGISLVALVLTAVFLVQDRRRAAAAELTAVPAPALASVD